MGSERVEVLSRGEELLERAQEVAHEIAERARELTHDGGPPGPDGREERTPTDAV
jgi:hypothetical protein